MRWLARKIVLGIIFIACAAVALPFVTMLLWNALVPTLFNGPLVSFWQALGLLLLSHILFRGGRPWRGASRWRHEHWRRRFEEKLQSMPPEERERVREGLSRGWGEVRERFREEWSRRGGCGPGAVGGPEPKGQK